MTQQPITREQALEETITLWQLIAKHNYQTKTEAFHNHEEIKHLADYSGHCPCCEYDEINGNDDCSICPIWPTERGCGCLSPGSPYELWSQCKDAKSAQALVSLAQQVLDNLDGDTQ